MSTRVSVALDIHALQVQGFADRGIGRYVAAYAAALARTGRVAAALLAPELPPAAGLPAELIADDLVRWDCIAETRRLVREHRRLAHHVTAPFLHAGPGDPAVLAIAPHWAQTGIPRVVTLYDLIPLRAPHHYLPTAGHRSRYDARAAWVSTADLVLAISEHTRSEAIDLLGCRPDRVVTVGAGVSPDFSPADGTDDELWRFHFGALAGHPYLLTVGGSDARKGTEQLVAAVGRLVRNDVDLHLVVVGDLTPEWQQRLRDAATSSGLGAGLVLAGPVGDELLRACYRRAAATVMPSLAEGSGLPVLESAACGTPALASWTTALREVAATPLAGFDPADVDAIADAITGLRLDVRRREEILAAQQKVVGASTWAAVAARAGEALDELAAPRRGSGTSAGPMAPMIPAGPRWAARRIRRRLALVGPLPPESGIGGYNRRILANIPASVQVDAVGAAPTIPDLPRRAAFVPAASFGTDTRPSSYDAIVYTLGNSEGHMATVALALEYPGWLWLHEVRLPAIATTALAGLDDEEFSAKMAALLARAYPGRPPLAAARRAGRSNLELIAAGVGLVGPLVERCQGVLVNSELARRLLVLDLAPLAHRPPIHVLPPACPKLRTRPVKSTAPPDDPLAVSFGVVSMSKRPDLLVDAAALTGCRLAFVGPCLPILAQVIADRAETRGVADRIQVVGPVDEDRWRSWMDQATLAVQLRESSSGESSAAVLDALSSGVPVLTNIASAGEWPEGTVSFLRSIEPAVVAGRMEDLLGSEAELRRLTAQGQAFAAAHQFDRLAQSLLTLVAPA